MKAEQLIAPTVEADAEVEPGADALEQALDRIGEDARERSDSYLEQTEVPEGGE